MYQSSILGIIFAGEIMLERMFSCRRVWFRNITCTERSCVNVGCLCSALGLCRDVWEGLPSLRWQCQSGEGHWSLPGPSPSRCGSHGNRRVCHPPVQHGDAPPASEPWVKQTPCQPPASRQPPAEDIRLLVLISLHIYIYKKMDVV